MTNCKVLKDWLRRAFQDVRHAAWLDRWLLLLPVVVWFSYQPNFHLARTDSMNLEFSLPIIYLCLTALIGLKQVWSQRQMLMKNRAVWLMAAFVGWNCLSLIWSVNPVRTILTAGLCGVLFFNFLVMLAVKKWQILLPLLTKIFLASAIFMSLVAIIQVAYGAWTDWGLCRGCTAAGFGFVRPSAFAIEPQFFGSLLIAPIIIVFYRCLIKKASKFHFAGLFILLMALYLTLSRGAIFALLIALVALLIIVIYNHQTKLKFALSFSSLMIVVSFGAGLIWHGLFTQLNPRVSDTFYDAVSKSVSQMTLGKISLPKPEAAQPTSMLETSAPILETVPPKAMFNGYVERSTNERTRLNEWALETWQKDARTILIGAGAGGAGKAIFEHTKKTGNAAEIVQNEFLSVLVELGLTGLVLWLAVIGGLAQKLRRQAWLGAILLAYMVQWNFFSGLPNALHIYCTLMLIFAIIDTVYAKTECINRRVHARQPSAPPH